MADKKFNATLQRGVVYVFKGKQYQKGIPVPVDEETKEYLEENAVDVIGTDDGEGIERQKFSFEEVEDHEATPRTRKRTRSAS